MKSSRVDLPPRSRFPWMASVVIFLLTSVAALAQTAAPKVGDRVEAEWKKGLWYTAKILEINAGQFKVRYESDGVIQSVPPDRLRQVGGSGPASGSNLGPPEGTPPPMSKGLPMLPGTAWKIDWGIRGGNVQVFLFCKSGRWEVVSPMRSSGAITLMGTYEHQGKRLVTQNMNGREVTSYQMAWNNSILELDSGRSVMRLHYNGTTSCK